MAKKNIDRSVCTIVSIVPFPINEYKPGMIPDSFEIPACTKANPMQLLGVTGSTLMRYVGEAAGGVVRIPLMADALAESIVKDCVSPQVNIGPNAKPGLFWVYGEWTTKEEIEENFPEELAKAIQQQNNWFENLVAQGDDNWEQYGSHKAISDNQRFAARHFGLSKPWLMEQAKFASEQCPMCMNQVHPQAVKCAHCGHILDAERFKNLGGNVIEEGKKQEDRMGAFK